MIVCRYSSPFSHDADVVHLPPIPMSFVIRLFSPGLGLRFMQLALLVVSPLLSPLDLRAQEEQLPGVSLSLDYETAYTPALAIEPFSGRFGGQSVAGSAEAIVARDLTYSDRFEVIDSLPAAFGGDVDYSLWDRLGAVYLLRGSVEGSGNGFVLQLELHEVLYSRVLERATFDVPDPLDPGFRMAVHRASDAVVEWAFDEPGMAASRIAFVQRMPDGTKELFTVDSDGENVRRVTDRDDVVASPSWSPDGSRLAFMAYDPMQVIIERDLASEVETSLDPGRSGNYLTPAYHPDGSSIAFSVQGARNRSGLFVWNRERQCCLTSLTEGPWQDFSPSFSPDGAWVAFNSTRLGSRIPQIYVIPTTGGEPELLSPYAYDSGGFYTAPDWSPFGDLVAFNGRLNRQGRYHILVARMGEGRRILQLTSEGNNEAPSWAPDGRHLVFVGERVWGMGLFVVDSRTGRIRVIRRGVEVSDPDWSPSIGG